MTCTSYDFLSKVIRVASCAVIVEFRNYFYIHIICITPYTHLHDILQNLLFFKKCYPSF